MKAIRILVITGKTCVPPTRGPKKKSAKGLKKLRIFLVCFFMHKDGAKVQGEVLAPVFLAFLAFLSL